MFKGKLSTIIIFKLCKFNVNLWTLCFVLHKVPKPMKHVRLEMAAFLLTHCLFTESTSY